jgi:hypothetical protein
MEKWKSDKQINNEKDELIKELRKTIAEKDQALQLLQPDVSISLERAKKYARHQHYVGTQQREFVEFEDWAKD